MRRPATVRDFLRACVYAIGVVQLAVAGFMVLWTLGGTFARASRRGFDFPVWLFALDVAASLLAVAVMGVAYQRGDLDTYEVRRHRLPRER